MMIHPSYTEMMNAVNADAEDDTVPVVSSRYSIVMATAGDEPTISGTYGRKALSIAVDEVYEGTVKILPETAEEEETPEAAEEN